MTERRYAEIRKRWYGKQADDAKAITTLLDRIDQLEAILVCARCGHLRSEHDDGDSPCFGGREGLKTNEGEYCMCLGFKPEALAPATPRETR